MSEREGITEKPKAEHQMKLTSRMNDLRSTVMEIINMEESSYEKEEIPSLFNGRRKKMHYS